MPALHLQIRTLDHERRLAVVELAGLHLLQIAARPPLDERLADGLEHVELPRIRPRQRRQLRAHLVLREGVLVELGDARLAVVPGAEEEEVARRVRAAVAVHLPLDVAVRPFAARVELDAHVRRQPGLEPERVVADAGRENLSVDDAPQAAVRPPRVAERGAIEFVLEWHCDGHRGGAAQRPVDEGELHRDGASSHRDRNAWREPRMFQGSSDCTDSCAKSGSSSRR